MRQNGRLAAALATLVHAQGTLSQNLAVLTQTQATFVQDMDAFRKVTPRIDEWFNRIEAILVHHERLLEALPTRLKNEIGFRLSEWN